MPDLKLCSAPDQVRDCAACKRNPDNWPDLSRLGPQQSHMKPVVIGDQCRSCYDLREC